MENVLLNLLTKEEKNDHAQIGVSVIVVEDGQMHDCYET